MFGSSEKVRAAKEAAREKDREEEAEREKTSLVDDLYFAEEMVKSLYAQLTFAREELRKLNGEGIR